MALLYIGGELVTTIKDVTEAAEMTDEYVIYRYLGNEEDYLNGKLYYWTGSIFEPIGTGSGGGGGGGSSDGNAAVMIMRNATGWLSKTVSYGQQVSVSVNWSSLEDELPTGNGTLQVLANGGTVRTSNVEQGLVTIDITPYLLSGNNAVRVRISDAYGNARNINFSVKVVQLQITSSFDTSITYPAGELIEFTYTPTAAIDKTVYFYVDDLLVGTTVVTTSGRQQSYSLAALTHGAHNLRVYCTAEIDGETVTSNELYFSFIVVDSESTLPIIATPFRQDSVSQYELLAIPYTVYTPNSLTSEVTLTVDGTVVQTITLDRTEHIWSYRADVSGARTLIIASGLATKTFAITVTESEIDVHPETNGLQLFLTSYNKSNEVEHPEIWEDEDRHISASLTGFNWVTNGWIPDEEGIVALRINNGARVTIPVKLFQNDFRTTGKTIEIEFATSDIIDYDSVIMNCMSNNRGLQLTPQFAMLKSEQSSISTQFKEDEHVTITFVVEKRNENRLILIAINGIYSGVVQYPEDDNFSQANPVDIVLGSDTCTTDIYHIRVYNNDLTRYQVLNNWIADTRIGSLMKERYDHNNVYDEYGSVVIDKLPRDLPYFILNAEQLPQFKGDKKIITGSYVDPQRSSKSFTFTGCQINVQGTSSAPYARKNYDMQFKQGFEMNNGEHADNYALAANIIPFNRFVLKADVASSESANNVELVKLYCDATPFKRREQEEDPKVRQGIYGFPIVVFWHDTVNNKTIFMGKYNFNLPKRAPGPYGYSGDMESWEFQNNTSNLMLFKTDYFSEAPREDPDTHEVKAAWRYDYEARFPSDEFIDYSKLQELQSFIYSTYRAAATGNTLPEPVVYTETRIVIDEKTDPETGAISYEERVVTEDVTYTVDNAEYRLSRFKHEFGKYAEVDSFIFYYIFTELFLMVDSRAKNLFIGFSGSDTTGLQAIDRKAVAEPYDMDTAIGTNNEGSLAFGYSLEDTDHLAGADVFNGQDSVLWNNLRDAFRTEIVTMYQNLRSAGILSYASVEKRFEDHQAKWPEAIFNEDSWFKYILPLTDPDPGKDPTDSYLGMMQGSKKEQRKWWLYNRFRYMDSKWNAGDARSDVIQVRGYAKADVTVTPFADIYPAVKYGSYMVTERGQHDVATLLACPVDDLNDTEIYIYSASQLAYIGDLSPLKIGFTDFSKATSLRALIVGSAASGYSNPNLKTLSPPASPLLSVVDARNCPALSGAVDMTNAKNIEHVYFDGTAISSARLPVGGILKTLHLPGTVTNLTVRNQMEITDFSMPSYSQVETLRVENCSDEIPVLDILAQMANNCRVRIIGFTMEVSSTADVENFFDDLDEMKGLDENGNNLDKAVVSGTLTGLDSITGAWLAEMNARYPDVTITYNHITAQLKYYSYDGATLLYTETIQDGGNGTYATAPSRASTAQYIYTFAGWSRDKNSTTADPNATKNVTADRSVYAAYSATVRTYTVRFYNGTTLLQTVNNVPYGSNATYTGSTPTYSGSGEFGPFTGWKPEPTNIQGNTDCKAQFKDLSSKARKILLKTLEGEYVNDRVTKIGVRALSRNSKLTSVSFPNAATINKGAFYGCSSLTSLTLPNAVTIGDEVFYSCSALTRVDLTKVASIGKNAFANCSSLATLIIRTSTVASMFSDNALNSCPATIYVPDNLVSSYKAASNWSSYADRIKGLSELQET